MSTAQAASACPATRVMVTGPSRFDMVGQLLSPDLISTDEQISAGLARRLVRYARDRMTTAGFASILEGSQTEVYTLDGGNRPPDRHYCVRWTRPEGGYIEVVGILTNAGWPTLDHGFYMGDRG